MRNNSWSMSDLTLPKIACIAGPTAVGKSALALALAEQGDYEIISVDSAKIYRGMDIGTAKPNAEQLARIPHHLIDCCEPTEAYSAGQFVADCVRLIDEIIQRGKQPLLIGGTMLYFRALQHGIADLPVANIEFRQAIDQEAEQCGWPALWARLQTIDPESAAQIKPTDSQRIQRALEVYQLTQTPLSVLIKATKPALSANWINYQLSLEPRSQLHQVIHRRFTQMLTDGLLDEVRALRARGDLSLALPSMRCVGYRQVWQHLAGEIDYQTMVAQAEAATRQLAKRQLTWLRKWPSTSLPAGDLAVQLKLFKAGFDK